MRSSRRSTVGDELSNSDGHFTIQQASRLLQIPAPTLRSWERRYGVPQTDRSSGGHRRYGAEQLSMLRRMRDAITFGRTAAEAAFLVSSVEARSADPYVRELLSASHALDSTAVTRVLWSASEELGLDRALDEVLFPAMRQIGDDWQVGRCDVAHEHLTTTAVRGWLTTVAPPHPAEALTTPPILLACGPRDDHTVGLESFAALLRQRGADCRLLGACVPVSSLSLAVSEVAPAAVVLVSHRPAARRAAVEALQAVQTGTALLYYAGNGFLSRQSRVGVPGTYLGDSLTYAADLVSGAAGLQKTLTPAG